MIEGEEYLGATGLHLAIAYGNDEVAEMLILSNEKYIAEYEGKSDYVIVRPPSNA